MEFAELIKISKVDQVTVYRPFHKATEMTLCITGHHLILSDRSEKVEELWILHRSIDCIDRRSFGSHMGGMMVIKCKDLKIIQMDIPGHEEFINVSDSLEKLSRIDDVSRVYAYFYTPSPDFNILEDGWTLFQPEEEFSKLIHSADTEWRISYVNIDFSVCPTYPRAVIVPSGISDDQLRISARFRQGGRFPVLSYRHSSGTAILRCSQPLCGPNGRRSRDDERIFAAVCANQKKGYIIDTRTPSTSQSAKAKGGGFEMECYYPRWKRINKSIDRFHFFLDSYSKLMEACSDVNASCDKWLSKLTISSWLTHVKEILNCACLVAQCVDKEKASVVVHGSEGMDITLCITALAQVILNPDCRSVRGFEALVEREWIQAGHPFWSRTTHGPFNDSVATKSKDHAPTFTIFLDCVWQIYNQFPCSFEFTERFLIQLADNAYFSNFGTFLCDSEAERLQRRVKEETISLWSYVNHPKIIDGFINCLYDPNNQIIWPSVAPISLQLWKGMYLRWIIDPKTERENLQRISEIIQRNKLAKANAIELRGQLQELIKEAEELGLVDDEAKEDINNLMKNGEDLVESIEELEKAREKAKKMYQDA